MQARPLLRALAVLLCIVALAFVLISVSNRPERTNNFLSQAKALGYNLEGFDINAVGSGMLAQGKFSYGAADDTCPIELLLDRDGNFHATQLNGRSAQDTLEPAGYNATNLSGGQLTVYFQRYGCPAPG